MEPYRRVPAFPHNSTHQRTLFFIFFIFLPFTLPIGSTLPLTRQDDNIVFLSYEEEKHVSCLDDALRKRWQHQQRSVALALAPLLFQQYHFPPLVFARPQLAEPDTRASTREDTVPRRAGRKASARLGGTRTGERCGRGG